MKGSLLGVTDYARVLSFFLLLLLLLEGGGGGGGKESMQVRSVVVYVI